MENKILHLVLKQKWYDMIASGEKKEEYREVKPYWDKRLMWASVGVWSYKVYDLVCFSCGYTQKRMTFKAGRITIGYGKPEWGAPKDKRVFIIRLGERIN